jgi:hypothetical protein
MYSYEYIKTESKKMREDFGISLPSKSSQAGLALVFMYNEKRPVSKKELTDFLNTCGIKSNDIQIGRHLKYKGWFVENYTKGFYTLVSIKEPHPNFIKNKRKESKNLNWDDIKKEYSYKCATCGCKEGEIHRYYSRKVNLQKGHKNPSKPLTQDNIIPQCQFCNRQDKDRWIYDSNGRVVGINNIEYAIESIIKSGRIDELKRLLKSYD